VSKATGPARTAEARDPASVDTKLTDVDAKCWSCQPFSTTDSENTEDFGLEAREANRLLRQVWSKAGGQNVAQVRAYLRAG